MTLKRLIAMMAVLTLALLVAGDVFLGFPIEQSVELIISLLRGG